jgi:iron complex outermembrane recepter protein
MRRTLILIFAVMFFVGSALADEVKTIQLEPIVITPSRYGQSIYNVSGSMTVLTEDDLRKSNATTVLDAMRVIPGMAVRDYFGNSVTSSIDIRGFGEQAAMNSLVLMDGRRLNEVDLSGVDWTQIPIEQISRIEVLRGGSGSVLYGDNAVAGVVNIITKKGEGKPRLEVEGEYGSYDMNAEKALLSGSNGSFSYWASASRRATHGYRENGYFKNYNLSSKIEYDKGEGLGMTVSAGYNNNNYGMPGALFSSNIDEFNRRYTRFPNDYNKDKSYYIRASIEKDFYNIADVLLDFIYRRKESYSNFIGANGGWNPYTRSKIDTYGFTPRFILDKSIFNFENQLIAGVDMYWYDNSSDSYDISDILADYTKIKKTTTGFYFNDEFSLLERLKLTGGYRHEIACYSFDDKTLTDALKTRPRQKAYSIGATYGYTDFSNVFFNINRNFRFPATDEYFTWGTLNPDLKTQVSRNYEAGINHQFNTNLDVKASLFLMDLKNELYYNPIGGGGWGANENYDRTQRKGVEAYLSYQVNNYINLQGGYSYTKSVFKEGEYEGKTVPMVPRHKANAGAGFKMFDVIKLNIIGSFTDSRYVINDQANDFKRLGSYFTLDTNISYSKNDLFFLFGINNILGKKYSEYGAYSSTAGATGYYPSPERNFVSKVSYKF